ncbi:hypothetical protein CHUAL_002050 [Chamberlinius hualienensis]
MKTPLILVVAFYAITSNQLTVGNYMNDEKGVERHFLLDFQSRSDSGEIEAVEEHSYENRRQTREEKKYGPGVNIEDVTKCEVQNYYVGKTQPLSKCRKITLGECGTKRSQACVVNLNDQSPWSMQFLINHFKLLNTGRFNNGKWVWKKNFNITTWAKDEFRKYGISEKLWQDFVTDFQNIVRIDANNIILSNVESSGLLTNEASPWEILNVLFEKSQIQSKGYLINGNWIWNVGFNKDKFAAELTSQFGLSQFEWIQYIDLFQQLYPPYVYWIPQSPSTFTYNNETVTVSNPLNWIGSIYKTGVRSYGEIYNGKWSWNDNFNSTNFVQQVSIQNSYNNSYSELLVHIFPSFFEKYYPYFEKNIQIVVTISDVTDVTIDGYQYIIKILKLHNIQQQGFIDNGSWVWNDDFNKNAYIDTLGSNSSESYWNFIIDSFSNVVDNNPEILTSNGLEPDVVIYKFIDGQLTRLNITDVIQQLSSYNVFSQGHVANGVWSWNDGVNVNAIVTDLQTQTGKTTNYWKLILNDLPSIFEEYDYLYPLEQTDSINQSSSDIPTPVPTQAPIQSITLTFGGETFEVENVDGLVKTLTVDNDLSAYGQVENGEFVWNTPTSQQELLAKLISEYGPTDTTDGNAQLQWSFILNAISQLVGVLPITGTPNGALTTQTPIQSITLTFGGQTFEVENVDGLVKTLTVDNDLSAYGQVENGEFVWNTPTSQQELLAKLISEYGPTDTTDGNAQLQWSFILNAISQLVGVLPITGTPNAALTTQTPIQSITLTFGGQTFEVENVDGLVKNTYRRQRPVSIWPS